MEKDHKNINSSNYKRLLNYCVISSLFLFSFLEASSFDIQGELSFWFNHQELSADRNSNLGFRYIPTFSYEILHHQSQTIDCEIAVNMNSNLSFEKDHHSEWHTNLKEYRWWLRYHTNYFEARLGLQKINFGAARLLRTLRWFDTLDPQDPLQFTEGVKALRIRYNFSNNANFWLWGLYGNDELKGWEILPTKHETPEFGTRFQFPLATSELAFTFHYRKIEIGDHPAIIENIQKPCPFRETKFAFDGIWDIGIGLWQEAAMIKTEYENSHPDWLASITNGIDYTFPIGNGLNILTEHLYIVGDMPIKKDVETQITAMNISYPLNFWDQLSLLSFYNWEFKIQNYYINWQRSYDQWVFHLSAFWSSDKNQNSGTNQLNSNNGQSGIQLKAVFYH